MESLRIKEHQPPDKIYSDAKTYYTDFVSLITNAKESILLETYIFDIDHVGGPILDALILASQRGVQVRILVDGYGTLNWHSTIYPKVKETGIRFRVYHALPWPMSHVEYDDPDPIGHHWLRFKLINRRNHKKLIVVDEKVALTGSFNISEKHINWLDFGAKISGAKVQTLANSFERSWAKARVIRIPLKKGLKKFEVEHGILLNHTRSLRKEKNRFFTDLIKNAKGRVTILNAYFIPTPKLLAAMIKAAKMGVEVNLIVPAISDVSMVKWIGRLFYASLIRSGVRVFEYLPRFVHAKMIATKEIV
ncbi:MAG: phosphatidylserine/phosphatidylglycerophosphate/cardiolipin synthase family protein, partial [Bdellovibrionales bacterium]|nr:phosphatidylserine/phosphatidylglycerophosphate/cardiolipin synthase family protein [Bdellovibrionales bacterium]